MLARNQFLRTQDLYRISKHGSAWLRWVLVEAAMQLVRVDPALASFYRRIANRSSAKPRPQRRGGTWSFGDIDL